MEISFEQFKKHCKRFALQTQFSNRDRKGNPKIIPNCYHPDVKDRKTPYDTQRCCRITCPILKQPQKSRRIRDGY